MSRTRTLAHIGLKALHLRNGEKLLDNDTSIRESTPDEKCFDLLFNDRTVGQE